MPIDMVEASAWRHLDVARDAIDMERARRIHALSPGESISFIDGPTSSPRRAQSVAGLTYMAKPSTDTAAITVPAADADTGPTHIGVLDLSATTNRDGGAAALLAANDATASEEGNAATADVDDGDLANRWHWFRTVSSSYQNTASFLDDWRSQWRVGRPWEIDMNGMKEYTAEWDKAHIGALEPRIGDYFSAEELEMLFSDSSLFGGNASAEFRAAESSGGETVDGGAAEPGSDGTARLFAGGGLDDYWSDSDPLANVLVTEQTSNTFTQINAVDLNAVRSIDEAAANDQEGGDRSSEGSVYGSESRWWEAEWDARMEAYDAQYSALNTFRGSVSQGYLDYANEMTLAFLQPPNWEDYVAEVGLEDEFELSEPSADDASADDGFGLNFDGLIDQAAGTSEASTTTTGTDATETLDASAQVGITEREQQGIDHSDDIQYQRLEEQAEANGTSGRLPDGRFQTADGRIVTTGGHAVTDPAQEPGSSSAYATDRYVHVGALPGVWPQGELTPAPDLPALPAELTPTLLDGRAGTGVPYRDQAGQIFYETFDADGKAVGLRSVSAAAAPLPLADLAGTAAPLILTGLTAEASYGPWPLRIAAGATLVGATWLIARGADDFLSREALTPDQVRDGQRGMINVPVSPGPGGAPGYVADNRDTSTPVLRPPDLLPPLTTILPTAEQSWEDLLVNARRFENQLPDDLSVELDRAASVGVRPITAQDSNFDQILNDGRIKFVILESGTLIIAPHSVGGVEISHAVLSGGKAVIAAGEADIAGASGSYIGIGIMPHSGHYLNGASPAASKEVDIIARQAFSELGITFPTLPKDPQ
jgi:hypothetical protein